MATGSTSTPQTDPSTGRALDEAPDSEDSETDSAPGTKLTKGALPDDVDREEEYANYKRISRENAAAKGSTDAGTRKEEAAKFKRESQERAVKKLAAQNKRNEQYQAFQDKYEEGNMRQRTMLSKAGSAKKATGIYGTEAPIPASDTDESPTVDEDVEAEMAKAMARMRCVAAVNRLEWKRYSAGLFRIYDDRGL